MCAIRKGSSGRGLQADAALPFAAAQPGSQAAGAPLDLTAALNLSLSVGALLCVCSWEGARGWRNMMGCWGLTLLLRASLPGPGTTSVHSWERERAVPRIRRKRLSRVNESPHSFLEGAPRNQSFTGGNQVFHSYTFTIFQHVPSNKRAINKTTLPARSFGWC